MGEGGGGRGAGWGDGEAHTLAAGEGGGGAEGAKCYRDPVTILGEWEAVVKLK